MKKIPEEYILKKTMKYKLVKRNSEYAIYEQFFEDESIGYEVIKIKKILKALTYKLGNAIINTQEGEYLPNTNTWGKDGFSYKVYNEALIKYQILSGEIKNV